MIRRHIRKRRWEASEELPADVIYEIARREIERGGHTVLEASWRESVYDPSDYDFRESSGLRRVVTVKYITGGQHIGLGKSFDWTTTADIVEFQPRKQRSAESSANGDDETGAETPVPRSASGGDGRIRTDE